MRHRVAGRRLNRSAAHRTALFRNLLTELFRHERIKTTRAKALGIRSQAERLITIAKRGKAKSDGVHERRQVAGVVRDRQVVRKLFDEIVPRFVERPGGYTRVVKLGRRPGDGAKMVVLELVD